MFDKFECLPFNFSILILRNEHSRQNVEFVDLVQSFPTNLWLRRYGRDRTVQSLRLKKGCAGDGKTSSDNEQDS